MDLRLIMSALTINSNLERIGDLAVNLAEEILAMGKKPEFFNKTLFSDMAKTVRDMMKYAIDSFIEHDAKLAQKVITTDDILDDQNKSNIRFLIDVMESNNENIRSGISMINISRDMERIGDHATNIAEDVFFIVEAQLIKHKYEKYLFRDTEEEDED
jgi:phosphate transport system protein